MGQVKIPYYRVVKGYGYWTVKPHMRAKGMRSIPCGPDGPDAWALAQAQNAEWDSIQNPIQKVERRAKTGSLEEAFLRYKATPEWEAKAPRTREEWDRAWARIAPLFGDNDPKTIKLDMISKFRLKVERDVSTREAHRCIKIWRALWRVAAAQGYCQRDADPSLGVRNREPQSRQAVWSHGEAVRLVKGAWRAGYHGLAAVIAVAWDSSLSPVDARSLTLGQRSSPDVFMLGRAKTGRAAVATLSRGAVMVLDAYLAGLGVEMTPAAPIFRNRSGRPYSKDTMGDDFRDIRAIVFGEGERRTLADFRRSGAVEALRGGASAEHLGQKMANDYSQSSFLQRTYTPVDLDAVRSVDIARRKGRSAGTKS